MAKAAIIIPAYNVEEYIHRALASAMAQTETDIEIIVIDDGSTDNTKRVIEDYVKIDNRIIFRSQNNAGVSKARNQGIDLATADYLLFLDSDDWLEKDAVMQLLSLNRSAQNKLVCTEAYFAYLQENGEIKREQQGVNEEEERLNREEALLQVGKRKKFHLTSSCYKLFNKCVIDRYSLKFREDIHHAEDGLFVFQYLAKMDGLCYTSVPLWNILERPGSATTAPFSSKWLTTITAIQAMMETNEISECVINNLKVYLVNWAIDLAIIGLRSRRISDTELDGLRKIMDQNWMIWIKKEKTLRRYLQGITIRRMPRGVLELLLRVRKTK